MSVQQKKSILISLVLVRQQQQQQQQQQQGLPHYLTLELRIGSCLACVYRVMDARGKFGELERSVRVVRGVATYL